MSKLDNMLLPELESVLLIRIYNTAEQATFTKLLNDGIVICDQLYIVREAERIQILTEARDYEIWKCVLVPTHRSIIDDNA